MDATQTKIIEHLREVYLLALKEIERLDLRITELESQNRGIQGDAQTSRETTASDQPGTDQAIGVGDSSVPGRVREYWFCGSLQA